MPGIRLPPEVNELVQGTTGWGDLGSLGTSGSEPSAQPGLTEACVSPADSPGTGGARPTHHVAR